MANQRSIDSKREEFRKYLESAGVTDTIVRVLTMIYESEDRPPDALQFVREQFVQCSPVAYELQITLQYLENAKEKIRLLESENIKLKEELETYKSKLYSKQISTADK